MITSLDVFITKNAYSITIISIWLVLFINIICYIIPIFLILKSKTFKKFKPYMKEVTKCFLEVIKYLWKDEFITKHLSNIIFLIISLIAYFFLLHIAVYWERTSAYESSFLHFVISLFFISAVIRYFIKSLKLAILNLLQTKKIIDNTMNKYSKIRKFEEKLKDFLNYNYYINILIGSSKSIIVSLIYLVGSQVITPIRKHIVKHKLKKHLKRGMANIIKITIKYTLLKISILVSLWYIITK